MLLAETTRRVLFSKTSHIKHLTSVNALTLWSQSPVTAHLLVVTETIAFCDLIFLTTADMTTFTSLAIFALRRESPMPANLLVMKQMHNALNLVK